MASMAFQRRCDHSKTLATPRLKLYIIVIDELVNSLQVGYNIFPYKASDFGLCDRH